MKNMLAKAARFPINMGMNIGQQKKKAQKGSPFNFISMRFSINILLLRCRWWNQTYPNALSSAYTVKRACVSGVTTIFKLRSNDCNSHIAHWPHVMRWKIISCCCHVFNRWSFIILTSRAHKDGYATTHFFWQRIHCSRQLFTPYAIWATNETEQKNLETRLHFIENRALHAKQLVEIGYCGHCDNSEKSMRFCVYSKQLESEWWNMRCMSFIFIEQSCRFRRTS